jgi:hypothetical protein
MAIDKEMIWHQLIDAKFGDEYLCRYRMRQTRIKKWFKISTVIFSASGIWSVYQGAEFPAYLSLTFIGITQLATMVESELIHSEKSIDQITDLRIQYYGLWNRLEKLFLRFDDLTTAEVMEEFYAIREVGKEAERLDDKLNITKWKRLITEARTATINYLNTYHG